MAALNFPNSPSVNDIHTENGVSFKWNGTIWKKVGASYLDTTNLNVTGIGTFAGAVNIGGVLTYEDVKNVDSVGIVTARAGIKLTQTQSKINLNTSDGSDNKYLSIGGGGDASQSRGAGITLYGNEVSSHEGRLQILAGNSGNANGIIQMHTGGAERLHITSTGDLSLRSTTQNAHLGLTANSTAINFTLGSTAGASPRMYFYGTGNGQSSAGDIFMGAGTGGILHYRSAGLIKLEVNSDNTTAEALRIEADGDIGLGTNAPNKSGYSAPVVSIGYNTSNNYSVLELLGNKTSDASISTIVGYNVGGSSRVGAINFLRSGANNSGAITFETYASGSAAERLRITSDGTAHLAYQGGNTNAQKVKISGTQHNFAVNNWGNSDGDYWMFGSNIEGNSSGNWSKPSTTTRAAGIVVDGRMGRTILLSSQTSTGTIDEHFTFDNSGVFHINKNGGGVSFAANTDNGGTSSATLMDDYEEGSYSSTIVSSNCTLDNSSATGYYIKVGNLVQVRGTFSMNTNSGSPSKSGSDNIVQSLPYTPVGNGTYTGTMLQQNWNWGGPTSLAHPHYFNPVVADYVCLAASDGIRFYMNRIEYAYQRLNNSHLHVGFPGYTAIYWSIMYQTT